ncbi:MAG: chemotaxis protein CheA, partial [Aestuariibacter sp.]|nr:chemotaxis protein CheA [Aestuariibacter sp.]
MSFDVDEDILQDFLVEAGEILEQLQEQLVDLENNPEDKDLLNAIFRGYHTVKGGAGFLSLTELVEICHGAENVFDVMRNGQRSLTPELMDVILQATDVVVEMFEKVKLREPLEPADANLVDILHKLSHPETADENIFDSAASEAPAAEEIVEETFELEEEPEETESATSDTSGVIDDITEDEFEALLDELHGTGGAPGKNETKETPAAKPAPAASAAPAGDDDITDDEFEALLDELHGKGKFSGEAEAPSAPAPAAAPAATPAGGDDEITDDEFEALLDQLHGQGKGPGETKAAEAAKPAPAEKPRVKVENEAKPTPAPKAPEKPAPAAKPAAPAAQSKPAAAPATAKKDEKKATPAPPPAETTVRVDTRRLDQIMNMVGELVLVRNRLLSLGININDESMSKA